MRSRCPRAARELACIFLMASEKVTKLNPQHISAFKEAVKKSETCLAQLETITIPWCQMRHQIGEAIEVCLSPKLYF